MRRPSLDPLSAALLPLAYGLAHRALARLGATASERRLAGVSAHFYELPARGGGDTPVLLLHGIADRAQTWALLMPRLRALGPVFALDLAGFGLSGLPAGRRYATIDEQVALARAFIREVIGRPTLLVGNSMGGWIAARLAIETPELARGLVLLDPGGAELAGRTSWEPFVREVALADLGGVRRVFRQMYGRVPLPLYLGQRSFQAIFQRDAVTQFIAAIDEGSFLRPADLRGLRVPTALIWGAADRFLPAGSLEYFRSNLASPALLLLPGCGHLPQQERPGQVARFILAFTAGLPPAEGG